MGWLLCRLDGLLEKSLLLDDGEMGWNGMRERVNYEDGRVWLSDLKTNLKEPVSGSCRYRYRCLQTHSNFCAPLSTIPTILVLTFRVVIYVVIFFKKKGLEMI